MCNKNETYQDSLKKVWSVISERALFQKLPVTKQPFSVTNKPILKYAFMSGIFLFSFSPWVVVHAESEKVSVISQVDLAPSKTELNTATTAIGKRVKQDKGLQVSMESSKSMPQVKLDAVNTLDTANPSSQDSGTSVMVSLNDIDVNPSPITGAKSALPVMASLQINKLSVGKDTQDTNSSSQSEQFLSNTLREKVAGLPISIVLAILALVGLVPVARRNE